MKVSIVGIGQVGAALAFAIVLKEAASQLVLVHHRIEIAEANVLDLQHSMLFVNHRIDIQAGGMEKTADSDVVVMTASKPWRDNFKDRMDAAQDNTELFSELIPQIAAASPGAKLVIISNPVDVLTYHAIQLSGFEPQRVIGTGTLVDSARFRALLSADTKIHPVDLRAYILGEHGNSQFPVFSSAESGGEQIDTNANRYTMAEHATSAGVEVFKAKGNTNFAVSSATMYIIDSILHDSHHTMPVSVYLDDFYGVSDVCLSVPAVIGGEGVLRILKTKLIPHEIDQLHKSAQIVRTAIKATKSIYCQ